MSCAIIVSVPKHRTVQDVALVVREIRPKVYDCTLGGYRQLEFSVAESGKEVHMTIPSISGSDVTTVWGQVSDDLYGRQLTCVLQAPMQKAA